MHRAARHVSTAQSVYSIVPLLDGEGRAGRVRLAHVAPAARTVRDPRETERAARACLLLVRIERYGHESETATRSDDMRRPRGRVAALHCQPVLSHKTDNLKLHIPLNFDTARHCACQAGSRIASPRPCCPAPQAV